MAVRTGAGVPQEAGARFIHSFGIAGVLGPWQARDRPWRNAHRTEKTGITKHKVADGIYLLRFETQYELTSTFLRVQEHYELPQFHGRIFTLEQYMDWYVAENGAFTYFQDWSGFNVPSTAFQPFYEGKFDPLTDARRSGCSALFRNLQGRFYVIGIFDGGKKETLTHELAHALFFIDDDYRQAVREAMRGYDTSALEKRVGQGGLCPPRHSG